jgi:hypothetical protein
MSDPIKGITMTTLQEHFAKSFARDDLAGAIQWAKSWYADSNQNFSEPISDCDNDVSGRAMAGHVSDYLEGFTGEEPESYNGSRHSRTYMDTKFGSKMYWAMLS